MIIVKVKGRDKTFKDVSVRRQEVLDALSWLTQNNPHYKDVEINHAVEALPVSGIPPELLTVETNDDICDETVELDVGPPTDTPSEDQVYDVSTEMSSFLPLGEQQQQELDVVRNQLSAEEPMSFPFSSTFISYTFPSTGNPNQYHNFSQPIHFFKFILVP